MSLLALAFLWQGYLGQTHIHLPPSDLTGPSQTQVTGSAAAATTSMAEIGEARSQSPTQRPAEPADQHNHLCILCLAGAVASAAILPQGPVITDCSAPIEHCQTPPAVLLSTTAPVPSARAPPSHIIHG